MKGFTAREGAAVAELDDEERMVIARIVADVGLLLGGEQFGMDSPIDRDAGADEADEIFRHLRGLEESLAEPDDPAVLRLLPSASKDDRDVADEFRRLTEHDLRDLKVARLRTMWAQLSEDGPDWAVAPADAMSTAAALTDVRLVLASRLRLASDEDAERLHAEIDLATHVLATDAEDDLDVDPERVWLGMLYQALTWLQESLVQFAMEEDAGE
ncbi:DUF2017 family protein [Demequina muriae]|uniref:DUF2017 family protein n=1 Tax=Demequina muriae TaxID=3051664 RepID=A0ABT8GF11_9MICO|nr:DUF2017 family protein [Demequina sp. EGI L300058]MDN4479854.1 DUF2017 family protein [Demequina sp. EGI L300058]